MLTIDFSFDQTALGQKQMPSRIKWTISGLAALTASAILLFSSRHANQGPPSHISDEEVASDFKAKEKYLNQLAAMVISNPKIFRISDYAINDCMPVSWPKDELPTAEELKKLGGESWEDNGGIWQENGNYMSLETVLRKHELTVSKWNEYCSLFGKLGGGPMVKEPDSSIRFAALQKRTGARYYVKIPYPANTPTFLQIRLYPWYGKEMPKYLIYCSTLKPPPQCQQVDDTDTALKLKQRPPEKWRFCRRLNDHWFIVRSNYMD
jgi:hypothetical protein